MSSFNVELPQSQRQNQFQGKTPPHPNREDKHNNHRYPKPGHVTGKANALRSVLGSNNCTGFRAITQKIQCGELAATAAAVLKGKNRGLYVTNETDFGIVRDAVFEENGRCFSE